MTEKRVYLDNAATTPLDPAVLEEMMPYFRDVYGNASSQHAFGRKAIAAIDLARERVADALGANIGEIYFTSGGTESDNWAIRGAVKANAEKGKHIVTTAVEHHAVLNTVRALEKDGYEVTYLPVDGEGRVSVQDAVRAMRDDTVLVSVMLANNEVGTIQPVREIATAARERGILTHTDAVQAVGMLPVVAAELSVDLISLSAHKFYGPKGIGALYVRKGVKIDRLLTGGAQERTMRGGTYNTPAIVGLGKAIEKAEREREENVKYVRALRDRFVSEVSAKIEGVVLNGAAGEGRLANNANLSFPYLSAENLLQILDRAGIAASAGSACASGTLEDSHVLGAMALPQGRAKSAIRFSFGKTNTVQDVEYTVDTLVRAVSKAREEKDLFLQFPTGRSEV